MMKLKLLALVLQLTHVLSFNQCSFLKLNNRNSLNNIKCVLNDINKKKILISSVNILKSSINNNNFNSENKIKKWKPPIGYIPESIKKKNNDINDLYKEEDLLFSINNESIIIKKEAEKINLALDKIKYLTNNIIIRSIYRNDGSNYYN